MEAKPIEVIMRVDFAASDGNQIVAHAERVQELVRCKNCIWFDMTDPCGTITPNAHRCKRVTRLWMDDDAFCSYGERREE